MEAQSFLCTGGEADKKMKKLFEKFTVEAEARADSLPGPISARATSFVLKIGSDLVQ